MRPPSSFETRRSRDAPQDEAERSHSSAARILCRAPGSPVFPLPLPPPETREGMARRSAQPFLMGTPSFRRRGASRRATSGFSVPGAVLPGCDGIRAGSPIRAASAALRRRRVQPLKAAGRNAGGRLARASRVRGYESRPRAPHRRCQVTPISAPLRRPHHRDVSRRRPQSSRTRRMIRAQKCAGISFCLVRFQRFAWRRAEIFKDFRSPGRAKRNPETAFPDFAALHPGYDPVSSCRGAKRRLTGWPLRISDYDPAATLSGVLCCRAKRVSALSKHLLEPVRCNLLGS